MLTPGKPLDAQEQKNIKLLLTAAWFLLATLGRFIVTGGFTLKSVLTTAEAVSEEAVDQLKRIK